MKYMVLLFIIDVITQSGVGFEDSVERIVKTGFRTKVAAKEWADKLVELRYTEHVGKKNGFRGNRYKIDRVIVNYNDATSENIDKLSAILC